LIKKHYLSALTLYKTEQAAGIKSVLVIDLKIMNEENNNISNVHSGHNKKFRLTNSRYDCTYGDSKLHGKIRKYFLTCKEHEDSKPPSKFQRLYFFIHLFVVHLTTLLDPKEYSVELLSGSE